MISYIGIDNGVSGSIGIITIGEVERHTMYVPTPIHMMQDYTKKKKNINRIHFVKMKRLLRRVKTRCGAEVCVMIERPMVNPQRFIATTSALRCLEATLCILESLNFGYSFLDSKEWQKVLLPKGIKGDALKKASRQIGRRLFPQHKMMIKKQKDADGLLIAEYCRRFHS